MDRIKDLNDVILQRDYVLAAVELKKSNILKPSGSKIQDEIIYATVLKAHESITDLEPGDVIVKNSMNIMVFDVGEDENVKHYALMPRVGIAVAVKPDNFDFEKDIKVDTNDLKA